METAPPPMLRIRKQFWISFGITLVFLGVMRWLTDGLDSRSIVSFELAKSMERAEQMMNGWDAGSRDNFLQGIYADFLFIIGYTSLFFFGCRYTGLLSHHYILRKAGNIFSWLAPVAGLCDVFENMAMLYTIRQQTVSWVVHFTYDMALIKFSLLFIMALFMAVSVFFWILGGERR